MIFSLLNQLSSLVKINYRNVAVEILREKLLSGPKSSNETFDDIYKITNSLISVLITLGMPTSECYSLVRNYLFERDNPFNVSFNALLSKVICKPFPVRIKLTMTSKNLYLLVDEAGGNIGFKNCFFSVVENGANNSIKVAVEVEAISFSAAKKKADADLHKALDVIAYMMGKGDIQIHKQYIATDLNNTRSKELREFEKPLVNALDRLSRNEFELYMKTMSRLHNQATDKIVRKISSAFRFFKNGSSEDTPESRFTAYWSALESLTLDVSELSLSHDAHVILSVLPCIALDYPVKQLFALRSVAKSLKWEPIFVGEQLVDIRDSNLGCLYMALKNDDFINEVMNRLDDYPYAKYRFGITLRLCKDPYSLAVKIQEHERKVELQLHRLYRTRNAIVHNAATPDRLEMLIVNLEHYLRSTLNAMVYMMNSAPSISSPEEAFNRCHYQSERVLMEMDPSVSVKEGQKEGKRKSIKEGKESVSDTFLVQWLSLHS
ncbi:HEPN domain-containing protein [Aeromonas sobria]|uniref:HEPN domain-containing protein n=1 Tax=Aeromonas sobria TaxID=646 RepID=UPI0011E055CD|nr:HEPN domain-containing protein [Aeromonas sobria]